MSSKVGKTVVVRDLSAYRGRIGRVLNDFGAWSLHNRYVLEMDDGTIYHATKVSVTYGTVPAHGRHSYTK